MPNNIEPLYVLFDKFLYRISATDPSTQDPSSPVYQGAILSAVTSGGNAINPENLISGSLAGNIEIKGGYLQSSNFVTGSTGWKFDSNGDLEGNTGTFRGTLTANSINIPDTTTANSFHVDSSGNSWWGATTFASAVASVSKAGAAIFTNITASNIIAYQTIVATSGGDYTTISAAVTAGKTRIFVRDGAYAESTNIALAQNTIIIGESKRGVEITFSGAGKFSASATGIILRNFSIIGGSIDFSGIGANTQTTTLDNLYTSTMTSLKIYNNAIIVNCYFFELTTFDLTGTITIHSNYISTQTENFTGLNAIACNGVIGNNWIVFGGGVNQNAVNYGIRLTSTTNLVSVTGNVIKTNNHATHINTALSLEDTANTNIVSGNLCKKAGSGTNTTKGIVLGASTTDNHVVANTFLTMATATTDSGTNNTLQTNKVT